MNEDHRRPEATLAVADRPMLKLDRAPDTERFRAMATLRGDSNEYTSRMYVSSPVASVRPSCKRTVVAVSPDAAWWPPMTPGVEEMSMYSVEISF